MFCIFRNDEKKSYLVCQDKAFADSQGGKWVLVSKGHKSFNLAMYESNKLAAEAGYHSMGGGVVAAPAEPG
jgi:hypothetical protein